MICLMLSVLGHTIKRRSHSHHKSKEMIVACKFSHLEWQIIWHPPYHAASVTNTRNLLAIVDRLVGVAVFPILLDCWTVWQQIVLKNSYHFPQQGALSVLYLNIRCPSFASGFSDAVLVTVWCSKSFASPSYCLWCRWNLYETNKCFLWKLIVQVFSPFVSGDSL